MTVTAQVAGGPERTERALSRAASVLDTIAVTCSGVGLTVILLVTLVQVAARFAVAGGLHGIVDLTSQFVMPAVVLFAITVTEREGRHVRVVVLVDRMPERARWWCRFLSRLITTGLLLVIVIASAVAAVDAHERGAGTSGDIHVPLVIVLAVPVIAFTVLLARVVTELARAVAEAATRRELTS